MLRRRRPSVADGLQRHRFAEARYPAAALVSGWVDYLSRGCLLNERGARHPPMRAASSRVSSNPFSKLKFTRTPALDSTAIFNIGSVALVTNSRQAPDRNGSE